MTKTIKCRAFTIALFLIFSAGVAETVSAQPSVITVNTTSDTVVANACANHTAGCSLRGAMQLANAGNAVVTFNIPPSDPSCSAGVCTITVGSALPTIVGANISISGPGANLLIIRPSPTYSAPGFTVGSTGAVSISGLTVRSMRDAGIVKFQTGTLNLVDVLLTNNRAPGSGGGISVSEGTIGVIRSTVSNNTADGGTGTAGGGIWVAGTAICNIVNSSIVGNIAFQNGGGGILVLSGSVNITNSTVWANVALASDVPATPDGGGIRRLGGTVTVKSSIIAQNFSESQGDDVFGTFTSGGFNLIGETDGSTGFIASTDLKGTNASPLAPGINTAGVQNYGGSVPTIGLLANSPAIDKGSSFGLTNLTTDQRGTGYARTRNNPARADATGGDGTDIGAYERNLPNVIDFDGDGRTEIGIFRPNVAEWWLYRSLRGIVFAAQFGASTDKITPADFTGDGLTDIAFWRPATGEWFIVRSENGTYFSAPFGQNGDIPVPADYDADGKADVAVFRPSSGFWFVQRSSSNQVTSQVFGQNGDHPIANDYDGDGRADVAIYRPSVGQWWLSRSTAGVIAYSFGSSTDKIVPGDYTGDGKTDIAFWRPATGQWFVIRSEDSSFFSAPFGASTDTPVPGDYDSDGKFDVSVFRPSNGTWFIQKTTEGSFAQQFGADGDRPLPTAFLP
jgi:CSLREA domain-containing protein